MAEGAVSALDADGARASRHEMRQVVAGAISGHRHRTHIVTRAGLFMPRATMAFRCLVAAARLTSTRMALAYF